MSRGSVDLTIYEKFLRANGIAGFSLYFSCIILQQVLSVSTSYWLRGWSQTNNGADDNPRLTFFLGIYAALGTATAFAAFLGNAALYALCVALAAVD